MPTKLTKPIFLCGYTNSGKTTIGKELARQLDVPFYDTDELITSQTGQTPQQIFASQGNEAFRNIEHEITKQVSSYPPCVISTGGGLLTYSRNGDLLSKAGTIIYLNRPFEDCYKSLMRNPDRPLIKNNTKEELLVSAAVSTVSSVLAVSLAALAVDSACFDLPCAELL